MRDEYRYFNTMFSGRTEVKNSLSVMAASFLFSFAALVLALFPVASMATEERTTVVPLGEVKVAQVAQSPGATAPKEAAPPPKEVTPPKEAAPPPKEVIPPKEAASPPKEVTPPVEPQRGQVASRPQSPRPQPGAGPVSFFFDDAEIFEVVQTVFGDILKANYIIDSKVKGKVSFRTITPIPREEVLPVMEIILRINGIGFVEERGLYMIIPLTDVSKELVHAQVGKDPANVAIELFTLKNVNLREAMPDVENAIGLFVQGGNMKVMPIQRLNALLTIASSKEQMDYMRKWVSAFDGMFAEAKPKVMVYPLQNSKAGNVSSILQAILGGGGGGSSSPAAPAAPKPATAPGAGATPSQPAPQAARTGSTVSGGSGLLVSSETRIFADENNNTLVILSTPADYAFIEETIKKIDVLPRQVVLETLLARVDLTDNLSFGFAWSFSTDVNISGLTPFVNPINLGGEVQINPQSLDVTKLPSQGFTFVGKDSANKVRAVITALAQESKAKILASPHILALDNREARIQVGQQIPLATSTTTQPLSTTTGTQPIASVSSTSTIQYKDIGIILKVKPQINDSGLVTLEVSQEVSSQGPDVNIAGQAFASINKTEATTNMVAQDGETIIFGGLIREDFTKAKDGIPYLSKIPILGSLFGTTTDNTTRAELIMLVTPHVVKSSRDAMGVTSGYVDEFKDTTKDKRIDEFIKERAPKVKEGGDAKGDSK
jgi:type II secretion system protein D